MEENILIESESKNAKKIILCGCLIGLILSEIAYLVVFHNFWWASQISYSLIPFAVCLILSVIISIASTFKIVVTKKTVVAKVPFKVVAIPMDSITAIGTGIFKRISITSPSGKINILFAKDNKKIYDVIYEKFIER